MSGILNLKIAFMKVISASGVIITVRSIINCPLLPLLSPISNCLFKNLNVYILQAFEFNAISAY